jgi:hypothetical protein
MSQLIERLNERAHDPARAIDEENRGKLAARPVPTEERIAAVEKRLGFPLPALLRQVYQEVGDGGFGPGYGIFPIDEAVGERPSLVDAYLARRDAKTGRSWPERLLPICDWGAGIESCLDCTDPYCPVVRVDPNMPKGDVDARVPGNMHYSRTSMIKEACWYECGSFETWLEKWVDGKRLFYAAYAAEEEAEFDFDAFYEEEEEEVE